MGNLYVRPIPVARGLRDRSMFTGLNQGQPFYCVKYVWYIEGTNPKIVVDAGLTSEQHQMFGGKQEEELQSLSEGLGKLGLKLEDIGIVVLTHLHIDHVGLASQFTRAKCIVQKAELDFARKPHVLRARHYSHKLWEKLNLEVVDGDKQIADGVTVMLTPGHSPGGQSVAVQTPKGVAVITGFCCSGDNFDPPREMTARGFEVVPLVLHEDLFEAYDSTLRVKRTADIVLANHDPKFMDVARIP